MVLGDADTQPTAAELERMKALVREAMAQGAVGLSTSLQYPPAPYAKTRGADRARRRGREATAASTRRTCGREAGAVLEALDEAIRIGREANIPVEIWHLKAAGKRNWGRMKEIVAKIEEARRDGVDIAADTYAYPAWFNSFSAFIPPWAHDGGDEQAAGAAEGSRRRGRASGRTWRRPTTRAGTTSGRRSPAPRPC